MLQGYSTAFVAKLGKRILAGMAGTAIIMQADAAMGTKIIAFVFQVHIAFATGAYIFGQPSQCRVIT